MLQCPEQIPNKRIVRAKSPKINKRSGNFRNKQAGKKS